MALTRCPECHKKISESAQFCPNCGFSFKEEDLEIYKQKLEQRRQQNAEINRKSTKLHLIWFAIFTIVILLASWLTGEEKVRSKNDKNFDRTLIRTLFVLLLQKMLVSLHIPLVVPSANLAPFEKGKIGDDEPLQQNRLGSAN